MKLAFLQAQGILTRRREVSVSTRRLAANAELSPTRRSRSPLVDWAGTDDNAATVPRRGF